MSSRTDTNASGSDVRPSYALPDVTGLAAQDDWTKAGNPKERKKLQNRVAQRIYRQRVKTRLQELQAKIDAHERANSNYPANDNENRTDNFLLPSPAASTSPKTPANSKTIPPADLDKAPKVTPIAQNDPPQSADEMSSGSRDTFDFQLKPLDTAGSASEDLAQAGRASSEWSQRTTMASHELVRDLLALQTELTNKLNSLQGDTDLMSHLATSGTVMKGLSDMSQAEMVNCHSVAMPEMSDTIDFTSWKPSTGSERMYQSITDTCSPNYVSPPSDSHMVDDDMDFNSHLSDTTTVPGRHDSISERFESIMDRVEAVGYENFDRLVAAYYSETFPKSSPLYNEQWLSRNRRLPQVLSEIFGSSTEWTSKERQGLNEEILKLTESVLKNESNNVHGTLEDKLRSLSLDLNNSSAAPATQHILDLKGMVISELPNLWSLGVGLASANPTLRQKDRANIALSVTLLLHFAGRFPKDQLIKVLNACI